MTKSIFDSETWPDRLNAYVVDTDGDEPRVHGYPLESGVATHESFSLLIYLATAGRLPTRAQLRTFEIALVFGSLTTVCEGPTHAAGLTQLCGASAGAVTGVAALGLAEEARVAVERSRPLFDWLAGRTADVPTGFLTTVEAEVRSAERLRALLGKECSWPWLSVPLDRMSLVLALFWQAGLQEPDQLVRVMTIARLPVAVAEAFAVPARKFPSYPVYIPPVSYEEG